VTATATPTPTFTPTPTASGPACGNLGQLCCLPDTCASGLFCLIGQFGPGVCLAP
jgi:hypothetical protein